MNPKDLSFPPLEHWKHFESLCCELLKVELQASRAEKEGREGLAQDGVDLYLVAGENEDVYGVQCKLRNKHGKLVLGDVKDAIIKADGFLPRLDRFIIATTAFRDRDLQKFAREESDLRTGKGLFSIELLFWEDINELLNKHDDIAHQFYGPRALLADSLKDIMEKLEELGPPSAEGYKCLAELQRAHALIQEGKPDEAIDCFTKLLVNDWAGLSSRQKLYMNLTLAALVASLAAAAIAANAASKYFSALKRLEKDSELNKKREEYTRKLIEDHETAQKYFDALKKTYGIESLRSWFVALVKNVDLEYPSFLRTALSGIEKGYSDGESMVLLESIRESELYAEIVWLGFLDLFRIDVDKAFYECTFVKYSETGDRCAYCRGKMLQRESGPVVFMKGDGKYLRISVKYIFCPVDKTLVITGRRIVEMS